MNTVTITIHHGPRMVEQFEAQVKDAAAAQTLLELLSERIMPLMEAAAIELKPDLIARIRFDEKSWRYVAQTPSIGPGYAELVQVGHSHSRAVLARSLQAKGYTVLFD